MRNSPGEPSKETGINHNKIGQNWCEEDARQERNREYSDDPDNHPSEEHAPGHHNYHRKTGRTAIRHRPMPAILACLWWSRSDMGCHTEP